MEEVFSKYKILSIQFRKKEIIAKLLGKYYTGNQSKYPSKYIKAKKMFLNGIEIKDICKELGMDRQILRENLKLDGLEIPNHNVDKNRRSNIFHIIDNEEKAYWLGFLYADGYVNEVENRIELTLKDKEHVEKFKQFINAKNKIATKTVGNNKYYKIYFRDKIMTADLVKKGCFQNKSLKLRFPTLKQVPKHLQRHFMRGYFDGDGCIHIDNKIEQTTLTVIGTKYFLNKMCKEFELVRNTYNRCGEAYEWRTAARNTVDRFLNIMYKDANIYLDRKYNLYLQNAVLSRNT